jgi:hypothetical protein
MLRATHIAAELKSPFSQLVLSDRLIALAQDADRAGYMDTAEHLVTLACSVFDEAPKRPHGEDHAKAARAPRGASH